MKSMIKKSVLPIAIIICLVLGASQTALASGTFRTTAGVHLRSQASTSSSSLGGISQDTSVEVLEHDPAGWSRVRVGSTTGYIRSDFLKVSIGDTPVSFVTTSGVHLRSGASTSSSSLAGISQGASVEVLEHDPAGWSRVQVGGTTGYIRSDFLRHAGTAAASSSSGDGGAGDESGGTVGQRQTLGNVNLRSGASTSSSVLKVLANGTVVDVIENGSNGWSEVSHNGTAGYIRSDLLGTVSSGSQQGSSTLYTAGNVNLRKGASTSSGIIKTLANATAVEVDGGESNGWYKVSHNGTEGYIRADLLTYSEKGDSSTRYTDGNVNLRTGASTSSSIIRTLANGTAVVVTANESNGWSKVALGDTTGYIRSDLLTASPSGSGQVLGIYRTITDVNVRSGPSTSSSKLTALPSGTSVDVFANESNGWSRVRAGNTNGYIRSDLLTPGSNVELVTMSEITSTLPVRQNIRVVDVRSRVSFNIMIFSKGLHADYDFPTSEDVNAMFSTRGGVRSWSARPLWVYVGNRVYAAASHGMPHDVNFVNNGVNGHFCLHFHDTVTNSKSYQADLRASVLEAYDKRPR